MQLRKADNAILGLINKDYDGHQGVDSRSPGIPVVPTTASKTTRALIVDPQGGRRHQLGHGGSGERLHGNDYRV